MSQPLRADKYPVTEGYTIVGKLQRAHGVRGELFLLVFSKEADWLDDLEEIRLIQHLGGKEFAKHKFSVEKKRWHKDGIIVHVKEITNRNRVEELKGSMFEVSEGFFVSDSEDPTDFYLHEVLGHKMLDENGEEIGEIVGFSSNTVQDLAVVKTVDGKFEIPLVDDWILDRNSEEKTITMQLPPGLLGDLD